MNLRVTNITGSEQSTNPNPYFRIFATCNTIGNGDSSGLYSGTQNLNQGQLDRWNIFATLNFMKPQIEEKIIENKLGKISNKMKKDISNMVKLANLVRDSFMNSDISSIISPRTSIMWGQNTEILKILIQPLDSHSLISATKMTKKLFLNFIRDASGGTCLKHSKTISLKIKKLLLLLYQI